MKQVISKRTHNVRFDLYEVPRVTEIIETRYFLCCASQKLGEGEGGDLLLSKYRFSVS